MKYSTFTTAAAVAVLTIGLAACGSPDTSTSDDSGGRAETLGVGTQTAVTSLNPVLTPVSNTVGYAYDPVIFKANDGSYLPDLATEWGYVGQGNTVFEFTLREGVTFHQGGELTAQAATSSLNYFLATPNPNMASVGLIESVEAVDDLTVRITYSAPFPNAVESLTQFYGMGLLIGPTGVASPDTLETASDGAGQYVLNQAETTPGEVIVFDAFDAYFEQDAIHFDEVEVRVLTDANARLAALKSGQIDVAQQIPVAQVGEDAIDGLQTMTGYTNSKSIQFVVTDSGPLASEEVRQAINYGIDRDSLVEDFYKSRAIAQYQTTSVGRLGYDADLDDHYAHDVEKATQLLADAGYPDGFEIELLTNSISDQGGLLSQAIVNQLAEIGITAHLTVASGTFDEFVGQLQSGEFDAVVYGLFANDLYTMVTQSIVSPGTLLNPIGQPDAEAQALIESAAVAPSADEFESVLQELNEYLTVNANGVPIVTEQATEVIGDEIVLPSTEYDIPQPNMIAPDPELGVRKN
ncbi:ABC transporter substrate-binding protein [Okibacterium endophyticum]